MRQKLPDWNSPGHLGLKAPLVTVQLQSMRLATVGVHRWGIQEEGGVKASDWRGRFSLVVRWSESSPGLEEGKEGSARGKARGLSRERQAARVPQSQARSAPGGAGGAARCSRRDGGSQVALQARREGRLSQVGVPGAERPERARRSGQGQERLGGQRRGQPQALGRSRVERLRGGGGGGAGREGGVGDGAAGRLGRHGPRRLGLQAQQVV